jgi:alpha-1,3-glucan synthase
MVSAVGVVLVTLLASVLSLKFTPSEEAYNLNSNRNAKTPLEYTGIWPNHVYNPSPENWRFPFYTLFLDRYVNGDPSNDNANGTVFEQDVMDTQFRHGGDLAGLIDTLDYIQGIGIKVGFFFPDVNDVLMTVAGHLCCWNAVYQLSVEI